MSLDTESTTDDDSSVLPSMMEKQMPGIKVRTITTLNKMHKEK